MTLPSNPSGFASIRDELKFLQTQLAWPHRGCQYRALRHGSPAGSDLIGIVAWLVAVVSEQWAPDQYPQ